MRRRWPTEPGPDLRAVLAAALVVLGLILAGCGSASGSSQPSTIAASALPSQARDTLTLIDKGGPFPYDQDGVVFENREGLLPQEKYGYYHEYTVREPGSPDRGPWRIVTGSSGEYYWTHDHYAHFERILR